MGKWVAIRFVMTGLKGDIVALWHLAFYIWHWEIVIAIGIGIDALTNEQKEHASIKKYNELHGPNALCIPVWLSFGFYVFV
jgi:hypothetical protein